MVITTALPAKKVCFIYRFLVIDKHSKVSVVAKNVLPYFTAVFMPTHGIHKSIIVVPIIEERYVF